MVDLVSFCLYFQKTNIVNKLFKCMIICVSNTAKLQVIYCIIIIIIIIDKLFKVMCFK